MDSLSGMRPTFSACRTNESNSSCHPDMSVRVRVTAEALARERRGEMAVPPDRRHISAALLLAGFVLLMAGVALFVYNEGSGAPLMGTPARYVETLLLIMGMGVILAGLLALTSVLMRAGDHLLAPLATAIYAIALASWTALGAIGLASGQIVYPLEVISFFAAGAAMILLGFAIVRTAALPVWSGWAAVGWSGFWMIWFFVPHEFLPPLMHQLVPPMLGLLLLLPRRARA